MQETQVWSLGWEDPLEEEMATHPSTFAWKIPRTKGPGRQQSTACKKSDTAEPPSTSTHTSNPLTVQRQFLQVDLWVNGLTSSLLVSSYSLSPAVTRQLSALKGVSCGFPSGVVSATLTIVNSMTKEPWHVSGWWWRTQGLMVVPPKGDEPQRCQRLAFS